MDRRSYLATGALVALAGCADLGDSDDRDVDGSADGDAADADGDDDDLAEYPDLVGTFDDFEDLDEWWNWQDIGSLEADPDRSSTGSQSALLTSSPASDGQVRIRRRLDDPIDVREVAPGVATATDTDRGVVRIQLQDEDAHYLEWSQQVVGDVPLSRRNFGITRVRGEPDLSEVVVLQVIRWFDASGEGRQWVDDFHFVPRPAGGTVMLQFHGGYESHYEEALDRVSAADVPATAFVPPDRLRDDPAEEGDRLTRDQVADLHDAGWTIGAHPATGRVLDGVDADDLEAEVVDPANWLSTEGYDDAVSLFAYPSSRYTEAASDLVRDEYDLAFAGQSEAQGYASDPHRCSVVMPSTPDEAKTVLERTAEWGGITTIGFYQLADTAALETLEETLAEIESHASAGDLEVIAPATMADEYVL